MKYLQPNQKEIADLKNFAIHIIVKPIDSEIVIYLDEFLKQF